MTLDGSHPEFAVLLVDDEPDWTRSLRLALGRIAGITHVLECHDGTLVPDLLARHPVGLVLLDLNMPKIAGEALLARIAAEHPEVVVVVISGQNQVETVVSCMKLGAFDYFVKSTEDDRLVAGVVRAVRMIELQRENQAVASRLLAGGLAHPEAFAEIITRDRTMQSIFTYVEAVARSTQPVLIAGESGTGKELLARAAHALSGRKGPLVAVNVAGLDDGVFADTLFGHVRGAYTGAEHARRGMIEEAIDGTLFLDEIGDLSAASQVKLLRLLQEGEFYPLGSDRPKRARARVIVATHHDLAAESQRGSFRRDLYFRLRTHYLHLPPLRERRGDLPVLLEHFVKAAAQELGKHPPTPPPQLAPLLATYAFPGNLRELRAMIFDAVSRHSGRVLSMQSFVDAIQPNGGGQGPSEALTIPVNPFSGVEPMPTLRQAVRFALEEAMSRSGGNQTMASRLLGISQPTMSKRLRSDKR